MPNTDNNGLGIIKAVKKTIRFIKNLFKNKETGYKPLKEEGKLLKIKDGDQYEVIDETNAPDELSDKIRDDNGNWPSQFTQQMRKNARHSTYEGKTPSEIAERATKNSYVFSDVINSPDLVGADTETEAVQTIAETDPGWAKMSNHPASTLDTETSADTTTGESSESPEPGASTTSPETGSADATASADTGATAESTGGYSVDGVEATLEIDASTSTAPSGIDVSADASTGANTGSGANAGTGANSGGANGGNT